MAREVQAAAAVLMIRPEAFASNPQTLGSNAFQSSGGGRTTAARARAEFAGLVEALRSNRVEVHLFEGRAERDAPDEVFPNNWVSTHADGTVVVYPLMAENRRVERRVELLETLTTESAYRVSRVIDLTAHERRQRYLEGTGSLVLDRVHRLAYANLSPRTHLDVLGEFSQRLDYEVISFEAVDEQHRPIYHTNAVMSVGTGFAVICAAAISTPAKRAAVLAALRSCGREVIELRPAQLRSFAGNLLEVATPDGPLIVLSAGAWQALDEGQRGALRRHGKIAAPAVPTIERFGGGSVRCMLAEIHLPR